jgi:glycosyltransferase involved in cell wall biosynthesis
MEPWVWALCADYDVPVLAVRTKAELMALVATGRFGTFFTPGLVCYADDLASSSAADHRIGETHATRIIGTIHDVREVTLENELSTFDAARRLPRPPRPDRATYASLFDSKRIDTIVTVSNHSRAEITRHFGMPRPRLVVLSPPAKRAVAPRPFLIGGRHDPTQMRYALLVNADRPEKNVGIAIRAFDSLFEAREHDALMDGLKVVLQGIDTLADLDNAKPRHTDRFIACPALAPQQFEFLLQQAEFLVYPSLEEGFGYPPVEAMRLGRPTVAANAGAIPEVCGAAAIYCDPRDANDVARAILQMTKSPVASDALLTRIAVIHGKQRQDLDTLVHLLTQGRHDDAFQE